MIRLMILPWLCMSFFMVGFPVQAQSMGTEPPIGVILAVEGEGNIVMSSAEDGKTYPMHIKDQIYRNDMIQTGPAENTRALITLIDGSRFILGSNSRFKISEYAFDDKDNTANMARYDMLQGNFLFTSGGMSQEDRSDVKILTPYGAIGVQTKETSLWGGQLGDQYGVYVDTGSVSLESRRGHIFIPSGKGTSIRGINAVAERPRELVPEVLAAAKATTNLNNTDKIKEQMAEIEKNYPAMISLHKDFIHNARVEQMNKSGSVRRQSRGVLKIEQSKQDEKISIKTESEKTNDPATKDPMARMEPPAPAPAPAESKTEIDKGPPDNFRQTAPAEAAKKPDPF